MDRLKEAGINSNNIIKTEEDWIKKNKLQEFQYIKDFEDKKNMMTYKNGVATLGIKNRNLPNTRPRRDNTLPSGIKIFALGENKPKVSKEKKK